MIITEQSFELIDDINAQEILQKLERCGRICYKSEDLMTKTSSEKFLRNIIRMGHESVLEHQSITVKVVTSRGISHQIVRHRVGTAYSQESQRYVNYSKGKYGGDITFIKPSYLEYDSKEFKVWEMSCINAETDYFGLLNMGQTPEQAREVLPNCTKTGIIITMNIRAWRHFFKQRTPKTAHPEMRELAIPMLEYFKMRLPVLFDDIEVDK